MEEQKNKLTYYQKNKDTIKLKYQQNKTQASQYNKIYYENNKAKRKTKQMVQYNKDYYNLKKQGLKPEDVKKKEIKPYVNKNTNKNTNKRLR